MPPTYFIILLLSSVTFHFILPIFKFVFSPYKYIGILFIVFGIVLNLWTDSLFKKKQTTVKPHEVPNFFIDYGPFKISRHPMYLGMFSILFGTAIFLGSISPLIAPVLFIIIILNACSFQWKRKILKRNLAINMLIIKKRVRRWI